MLIPLIQIIIELVLTVTLIATLGFGVYIVITLKNIGQVIQQLEKTKNEALTILREADHDLNKLKIKIEILKSAIKRTDLPRKPEENSTDDPKSGS